MYFLQRGLVCVFILGVSQVVSAIDDCKQHSNDVPFCSSDCTGILQCHTTESTPYELEKCQSGYACQKSGDELRCVKDATCPGPPQIQCPDYGMFPDPYNCSVSYKCAERNEPPIEKCTCPTGTLYSASRQTCDVATGGRCCRLSPTCLNLGDFGCLGNSECDSAYCYICTRSGDTLLAQPITCLGDADCTQVPPPPPLVNWMKASSGMNDDTRVAPSCEKYDSPPSPPNNSTSPVSCTYPGQLIADPSDCHFYFRCDSALKAIRKNCPTGYSFESLPTPGCVKKECVNSKKVKALMKITKKNQASPTSPSE